MSDDHVIKTIAAYDENAKAFDVQADSVGPKEEREKFISLLPSGGTILDFGCGSGRDTLHFTRHGFQVTGIDLSKNLLELAKVKVPEATFLLQDMRAIRLPGQIFDGIWACASLMHLKRSEIPSVLTTLLGLLKPQGHLFVLVKRGEGEREQVEPSLPNTPRFFTFFSEKELRNVLISCGFTICELYVTGNGKWIASFSKK